MPHAEEANIFGPLNFYSPEAWPADKPRAVYLGTVGDKLRQHEPHVVELRNVRTAGQDFTLDRNGFRFTTEATSLQGTDFDNEELVQTAYYAESERLLKSATGASAVHIFNHLIRRNNTLDVIKEAEEKNAREGPKAYVQRVHPSPCCHVDQSYTGAEETLNFQLPDQAEERSKSRWAIINVWRPIKPVKRDPLVVCDWQTVDPARDLVELDQIVPAPSQHAQYAGPSVSRKVDRAMNIPRWEVAYSPKQNWYLASDMQPEDCFLIKCFDSSNDGIAKCCPHGAFSQATDQGPPRESIELRCLVFWDD